MLVGSFGSDDRFSDWRRMQRADGWSEACQHVEVFILTAPDGLYAPSTSVALTEPAAHKYSLVVKLEVIGGVCVSKSHMDTQKHLQRLKTSITRTQGTPP